MTFLSSFFIFNLFYFELFAYNMEPPLKNYKDGSKSAFIQVPYLSVVRDQKVKEIQEEITNNWPEGIITYYLDDKSYGPSIGVFIRSAMGVLESSTCIRFRAAKDKPEENSTWLHITNRKKKRECVHDPDIKQNGEIILILGYDCLKPRDLLHSLLHGIGFRDEVTHPHRDNYVQVVWDNIQPAYRYLYRNQPVDISRSIVEYDPFSIMHFHDRAFSINGKATIFPMEAGLTISPSESLSQLDKMKLQLYFGHECNKKKFSSLMETCKISLKSKKGSASDEKLEKQKNRDENEVENAQKNVIKDKNDMNESQEEQLSTGEKKLEYEEENQENEDINKHDDKEENQQEEGSDEEINKLDNEENDYKERHNTREAKDKSVQTVIGIIPLPNVGTALEKKDYIIDSSIGKESTKDSGVNLNYDSTDQ